MRMGVCNSRPISLAEQQSRLLDRQIKLDEQRMSNEAKLLLLGAGDSGKSTILKSMRVIHDIPFHQAELDNFRRAIFLNVVEGMRALVEFLDESGGHLAVEGNIEWLPYLFSYPEIQTNEPYPRTYYEPLRSLWNDDGVQQAFRKGNQAAIPENLAYYYAQLDRLFHPDYQPTQADILRCRSKTTGIIETTFTLKDRTYRIFDVGGQRSERRKWIHCFQDVTAVFFVVPLSGYDCCLAEERDANQMQESILLFDSICNSRWFTRTSMILFLNKVDIFRLKIYQSSVRLYFPDYQGADDDFIAARNYFRQRFLRLNRSKVKQVYPAYTNATDPVLLKVVMASVTDIIISTHLRDSERFPFTRVCLHLLIHNLYMAALPM